MENFDLESHLQGVYSAFPEAKHRPLIGLTANYEGIDATLRERYYKQVVESSFLQWPTQPSSSIPSSSWTDSF